MLFKFENLQKFSNETFICVRYLDAVEQSISYAVVLDASANVCQSFRRLKVRRGVGIALSLKQNSPGLCVLLLSILNENCHFCPLPTKVPTADLEQHLESSRAVYLISDDKGLHEQLHLPLLHTFNIFGEHFYFCKIANSVNSSLDDELCYIIATSGSTGAPKMVHVPYVCIAPNITALSERLRVTSRDVIYLCTPLTFDPFVVEYFLALQNGATLLITPQANRLASASLLPLLFPAAYTKEGRGITLLQITPSRLRLFGSENIRNVILHAESTLRNLILGGEQFPTRQELHSWLSLDTKTCPAKIHNIYGITEISCWSSIHEYNFEENMPIGSPLDEETHFRIINDKGEVITGVGVGALQIGSATRICRIVEADEEKLESELSGAIVYRNSGDLVKRDAQGQLFHVGRTDAVIKRLGKRINLTSLGLKIQELVNDESTMMQVLCLWLPESQRLICCWTAKDEVRLEQDKLLKKLPDYEKPNQFLHFPTFPLNAHGKVDRRSMLRTLSNNTKKPKLPADIFQSFLRDTLAVDMNDAQTDRRDSSSANAKRTRLPSSLSFLSSGGSSMQALSLASEIGALLSVPAEQRQLLEMCLDERVSLVSVYEFLLHVKSAAAKQSTTEIPMKVKNSGNLNFLWRADLRKCVDAAPTLYNDCIYIGSHAHLLLAIDASAGHELAHFKLNDRIECKVTIAATQDLFLVGCYDGNLYAYNLKELTYAWRVQVGGMIKATPWVEGASVIVASYAIDCNLCCICLRTQRVLWRIKVGGKGICAAPVGVSCKTLLVCTLDGSYARIGAVDGSTLWARKCETPIFSTPALLPDVPQFVVAEVHGDMHVCCLNSGEKLHTFHAPGNVFSSLVVHASKAGIFILFGCYDAHLYCVHYQMANDVKAPAIRIAWTFALNAPIYAAPTIIRQQIESFAVACSVNGLLVALSLDDGTLIARHDLQAEVFSSLCCAADESKIYFGCRDNYLYCFQFER